MYRRGHRSRIPASALAAALFAAAAAGAAEPLKAETRLIAASRAIRAGEPFTVGVHIRMPAGAHVYFANPGDAGLPTTVQWTLPPGFVAGPIRWPVPARFAEPPLMSHGYADEVVLPVEITPPADLGGIAAVRVAARVDWLLCKEACVPGGADLALGFRVAAAPGAPGPDAALLARFEARVPRPPEDWQFRFAEEDRAIRLTARPPAGWTAAELNRFVFIPHAEDLVEPAAPQAWTAAANGTFELRLPKTARRAPAGNRLEGVLREGNGYPAPAGERFWSVSALRLDGER